MIFPLLQRERSIDDFIDKDEGCRLATLLADKEAVSQEDSVYSQEVCSLVREALVDPSTQPARLRPVRRRARGQASADRSRLRRRHGRSPRRAGHAHRNGQGDRPPHARPHPSVVARPSAGRLRN